MSDSLSTSLVILVVYGNSHHSRRSPTPSLHKLEETVVFCSIHKTSEFLLPQSVCSCAPSQRECPMDSRYAAHRTDDHPRHHQPLPSRCQTCVDPNRSRGELLHYRMHPRHQSSNSSKDPQERRSCHRQQAAMSRSSPVQNRSRKEYRGAHQP